MVMQWVPRFRLDSNASKMSRRDSFGPYSYTSAEGSGVGSCEHSNEEASGFVRGKKYLELLSDCTRMALFY
jgi:hypothetical protein